MRIEPRGSVCLEEEPWNLQSRFLSATFTWDMRPYVWFNTNAPILEKFLDKQLRAADVKAVVILGDLFDQWNIP
jgi:hypothetical protein